MALVLRRPLRHAVPVRRRRSWLQPPRLLLPWAAQCAVVLAAALTASAALGSPQRDGLVVTALVAVGVGVGSLGRARHLHRDWQQLQDDFADEADDLVAAEQSLREGTAPASEQQRWLALRMAELGWRDVGGWAASPGALAAACVVLLVLAVTDSPWWFPLGAAAGAAAVVVLGLTARLARRRAEREAGMGL